MVPIWDLLSFYYKAQKHDFFGKKIVSFLDLCNKEKIYPTNSIYCENPIFIMSVGWRSGSTLVQRLVSSSKSTIIWGEPFERLFLLGNLSSIFNKITNRGREEFLWTITHTNDLENQWIANLNPGVASLLNGCRAFLEETFADSACKIGFKRWGAKWVRTSGYYARFLQYLYPEAKFLIVFRHPCSCYSSYKGKKWSVIYPFLWVKTATQFFYYWTQLAKSYIVNYLHINCTFVMYEELVSNPVNEIRKIEEFLDLDLNLNVINQKKGGTRKKRNLNLYEKMCYFLFSNRVYTKLYKVLYMGNNEKV